MAAKFIPYPEIEDATFYDDIYWKKEFHKTRAPYNFMNRD